MKLFVPLYLFLLVAYTIIDMRISSLDRKFVVTTGRDRTERPRGLLEQTHAALGVVVIAIIPIMLIASSL